jgi:hypothetical protein
VHRAGPQGSIVVAYDASGRGQKLKGLIKATILRELAANKSILVVYGSSHWATFSRALGPRPN